MRIGGLALIALMAACGGSTSGGNGGAGGTLTGAGGGGGETGVTTSTSSGMACVPGQRVACACLGGEQGVQVCLDDGSGYGPCTGCMGQGGNGSGGGPQPDCQTPADCGVDTECATWMCVNGTCALDYAVSGTEVATQVMGDCVTWVCDGNGNITSVLDVTDVPDDSNECTNDECNMGSPANVPVPTGTTCSTGLCDSNAMCVQYIPVMCDTPAGVFVSCDGVDHSQMYTLYYDTPNGLTPCHPFAPFDVGYCVPGSQCEVNVFGVFHYGTCL